MTFALATFRCMYCALGLCLLLVADPSHAQATWDGPTRGPVAQPGKKIVYIASDLKNGGVVGVYRGLQEAARHLGWDLQLFNGAGDPQKRSALLVQALALEPDGLVFGGFEPHDHAQQVAAAKNVGITLVGWHAAKTAGPSRDLFFNVTTDSLEVARLATDFVLRDAASRKRSVGVVIFNDKQFAIANAKTDALRRTIEACKGYQGCRVLAIEDVPISDAANLIPIVVPKLVARFGADWTYSLAINDVYFDHINYPLIWAKRTDIVNVSAGDGSAKAIGRVLKGRSQQAATVAEPLKMQGYQLADELNRAFAGEAPSGYVTKPVLVTKDSVVQSGDSAMEFHQGFESAYTAMWRGKR